MAATILDGEKGGKRRSEKDDRPWVGPCMLAGSYSIDATPDLLYRSTYLLVLLRIQNAAGSSYTRLACVGVTKPVDATLHGVANPSGRRTRACHPSSLASPQVDRRACHADAGAPGAQGPARTRTAATAVQLARGFCSIDRSPGGRRRAWRHMPALPLARGSPPAFVPPAGFPFRGKASVVSAPPEPKAPARGAASCAGSR